MRQKHHTAGPNKCTLQRQCRNAGNFLAKTAKGQVVVHSRADNVKVDFAWGTFLCEISVFFITVGWGPSRDFSGFLEIYAIRPDDHSVDIQMSEMRR
jgi:hypothetical protein